jgi:hypothetical protein
MNVAIEPATSALRSRPPRRVVGIGTKKKEFPPRTAETLLHLYFHPIRDGGWGGERLRPAEETQCFSVLVSEPSWHLSSGSYHDLFNEPVGILSFPIAKREIGS